MSLLLFPGQADQGEFPTNSPFPTGTSLLFQQATAPVGWVAQTSAAYNDAILRVMNPANFIGTGGVNNSSTFISSQYSIDGHTLSQAEMPSHNHADTGHNHGVNDPSHAHSISVSGAFIISGGGGTGLGSQGAHTENPATNGAFTGISLNAAAANITFTGGNAAHNHTHTANLKYVDHIVATKS